MVQALKYKKQIAVAILLLAVAYSIGRFSTPAKVEVREVEKVVYRERVKKDEDRRSTRNTRETRLPDGTVIKESVRTIDRRTVTDTSREGSSQIERSQVTENRPGYRIGIQYVPPIANFQPQRYGLYVERRLFAELYLGLAVDSNKTIGASVSIGF
jgi:hypothetical protein